MNRPGNDLSAVTEVVETRTSRIWIGEDGIGRVVILPGAEETLEDAKNSVEVGIRLAKNRRVPAMTDIRDAKSVTREGREFYASEESAKLLSASAILVDSQVGRMIGNFYIFVNKPIYPTQVFSSEQKAIEWLKGFL